MKRHMAVLALWLNTVAARGDQLFASGQEKDGWFRGFEDGRFVFQPERGKVIREPRSSVTRVTLAKPAKASYQTSDGKTVTDAVLKSFERSQFVFEDASVPAIRMKKLALAADPADAAEGDAGGGYPIPQVDISGIGGDLAPEQQAIVGRYRGAKKAFDDYVAESARLVQEMDKATGERRTQLLNQLRLRKNAEQPLRAALVEAFNALAAAFPAPANRTSAVRE